MDRKPTITFTLVDREGHEFHGSVELTTSGSLRKPGRRRAPSPRRAWGAITIGSNLRAFVKRYARNRSGARQFTLILAFLAKGDPSVDVATQAIETAWKKTAGLLGGPFQRMYGTIARENDWAESPKRGASRLAENWKGCLAEDDSRD